MNELPKALRNELTGIVGRDRFDDPPGDLEDPVDLARWYRFRERYHRAQSLDGPDDFPLQLDVELTSQCNLRCSFCVQGYDTPDFARLDRAAFERIVLEGEAHGLVSMKLNYINEPLLVVDLADHVRFAKSHGVLNVYFATNGIMLDERRRDALIDARLSKIMISIDATTPETYERMRHSKHFDRIESNILALLNRREQLGVTWPLVRVNFLKTELNIDEGPAFLARWTGVADAVAYQDQVGLPGISGDVFTGGEYVDHSEFRCSFPFKQLVVDSAGHILPCCTFSGREMPLGSIDDMTLAEAWRSRSMLDLKDIHRRGAWRENPICAHCILGGDVEGATQTTDVQLVQLAPRESVA